MTNPDSDRSELRENQLATRVVASMAFSLLWFAGFYFYVTLAFAKSYREPLTSVLLYGTVLFVVVLTELYLAKTIYAGAYSVTFSIKTLLLVSMSFSVWICILIL